MSRNRYHFIKSDSPHFLTCTVLEWLPVFTRRETVQIVLDSWTYQQKEHGLRLYGFVVLENHLHAVAEADDLPALWSRFKSYTARKIIDFLKVHRAEIFLKRMRASSKAKRSDREYQFWQEGSHPQLIEGEAMLRQKLEYIHLNPVKRGYVEKPEYWRWSSAANYSGGEGVIDVCTRW